jgi:hypothetical protein
MVPLGANWMLAVAGVRSSRIPNLSHEVEMRESLTGTLWYSTAFDKSIGTE